MQKFDLIVIGAGPGGYLAAQRASEFGLKVLLIEKEKLGGVCLNEGCIPTKTLLHSSKILSYMKSASGYGITAENVSISHKEVIDRKNCVVKNLVAGVKAKMKKNKVTVVYGHANIEGKEKDLFTISANDSKYYSQKILIATGSSSTIPPIKGVNSAIESGVVVTSQEMLDIVEPPINLAIIGSGVIGLEMACYYNMIGSKVTVFEMLDHIAGEVDSEIGDILRKEYEEKGVKFHLSSTVTAIENKTVHFKSDDKGEKSAFDKILISVGRRPNITDIGLDQLGVATSNGGIDTDAFMRTNIEGIYAVGDVNGKSMLAHTAYREAEVAVNHMMGKKDTMRYKAIPSVIYSNPEVASVGETMASAQAKGLDVKTAKLPMNYSGRYMAEVEKGTGICKIVVDTQNNRIVGVHMIGSYVSEMIFGAALMIETELRVEDVKEMVFPHPTVSEILRETIFEL
jgi:dihydrolipoamide dehydrogenase